MTTYRRQKSFKIPKGQSISENRKRIENTMTKLKTTKGQNTQWPN